MLIYDHSGESIISKGDQRELADTFGKGSTQDVLTEDTTSDKPQIQGHEHTNEVNNAGRQVVCSTEYETKTPGQTVASMLNKSVNIGFDFAAVSQDIDGAISTIASALINKVISASFGAIAGNGSSGTSGQGIFD